MAHGGDRRSKEAREDQVDNIKLKGGTEKAYLRARLERDNNLKLLAGQKNLPSSKAAGAKIGPS